MHGVLLSSCPFWREAHQHINFSFFILSFGSSLTFLSSLFVFPDIQYENLHLFLKYAFFKKWCLLSIAGELVTGIPVTKYNCIVNPEFLPRCTRHVEQPMARNCFVSKPRWNSMWVFSFFLTPIIQALTEIQNYEPYGCLMSCLSVTGFSDVVFMFLHRVLQHSYPSACHQTSRAGVKPLIHLIRFG